MTKKQNGNEKNAAFKAAAKKLVAKMTLPEKCAQPTTAPKTGKDNKRQINCFDPDGTRVEIMTPASVTGSPAPSSNAPIPVPDKLKR